MRLNLIKCIFGVSSGQFSGYWSVERELRLIRSRFNL